MTVVSMADFEQVALANDNAGLELVCGVLRRKPGMTADHNQLAIDLTLDLGLQLRGTAYTVRHNSAHLEVSPASSFVPDVCVIPRTEVIKARTERRRQLEVYAVPLPLVVEIWSPSTGDYDVETKFPEYKRRGDLEIWRVHPYDKTLTAWRRRADGSYSETIHRSGSVEPIGLPGVRIDLDGLFA